MGPAFPACLEAIDNNAVDPINATTEGSLMRKTLTLLTTAVLTAVFFITGSTAGTAATPQDPYVAKILEATNQYRAAHGAAPVRFNESISRGSHAWTLELNARFNAGTFNMATIHRQDAGLSILPPGADMYSEVIAINNTAQQVVDGWMNSPPHRVALLDKRATDMGIGWTRITAGTYTSMNLAVANLAGYAANRNLPPSAPYTAHVQNRGWLPGSAEGTTAGTVGQGLRLEALDLGLANVSVRAHVQDVGWQPWRTAPTQIGTLGRSLRMEAIQLKSTVPGTTFTYRVHVQDIGWMPWVADGRTAGTEGRGLRIEAVEIRSVKSS